MEIKLGHLSIALFFAALGALIMFISNNPVYLITMYGFIGLFGFCLTELIQIKN